MSFDYEQVAGANDRHRADHARLGDMERNSARLTKQLEAARRDASDGAHRLEAARQGFEAERRGLSDRQDAVEHHWAREVGEARQALAAERKRFQATECAHADEITRVRETLGATQAERAQLTSALTEAREALATARVEGEHWKAVARNQERHADEAVKGLEQAQASSVRSSICCRSSCRRNSNAPRRGGGRARYSG